MELVHNKQGRTI